MSGFPGTTSSSSSTNRKRHRQISAPADDGGHGEEYYYRSTAPPHHLSTGDNHSSSSSSSSGASMEGVVGKDRRPYNRRRYHHQSRPPVGTDYKDDHDNDNDNDNDNNPNRYHAEDSGGISNSKKKNNEDDSNNNMRNNNKSVEEKNAATEETAASSSTSTTTTTTTTTRTRITKEKNSTTKKPRRHRKPKEMHRNSRNSRSSRSSSSSSSLKEQQRRNGRPPPPTTLSTAAEGEEEECPFPSALRCQSAEAVAGWQQQPQQQHQHHRPVLLWHSPVPYVSVAVEESMIDTLVRWKDTERGMMKDQPEFRIRQVRELCRRTGVGVYQALSLRRHHIKRLATPATLTMSQLGLGRSEDIRESARLFELAVHRFLRQREIPVWTERQQKDHYHKHKRPGEPFPPTPDFVMREPVLLKKFVRRRRSRSSRYHSSNRDHHCGRDHHHHHGGDGQERERGGGGRQEQQQRQHDEEEGDEEEYELIEEPRLVCWMEAKMFYGASTIDSRAGGSAVGNLLSTAEKYARWHGPGAMVFMHGCGDRLASELRDAGVTALDCGSPETVDLRPVEDHQRTWCANDRGFILP